MRYLLFIASCLVFGIGLPLFVLPDRTNLFFAWTINPPLTAAFLGAGYLASFTLEFLCARQRIWAMARVGVPAVLLFTLITLLVTLIHIDKFSFGSGFGLVTVVVTWAWLAVYAAVPLVMLVLLILQLRSSGNEPPRRSFMPRWFRLVITLQAVVMLLLGVTLLFAPTEVASLIWPWKLSALTGRAIGAWLVGIGVLGVHIGWENDWRRVAPGLIFYALFGVLQLVALARFAIGKYSATGDAIVDWSDVRSWVYLVFLVGMLLVGAYGWAATRISDKSAPAS